MEEINSTKRENRALKIKSQAAIRCAKAALLLSSLKIPPSSSSDHHLLDRLKNDEVEMELKRELVKARMKNKKMRFCSRLEFCLRLVMLLSLWTLCFLVVFILLV